MKAFLIGGAIAALATGIAIAQPAPPPPPGVAEGTAPLPRRMSDARPRVQMKMMSDHVMTRDEVVAHVRQMFGRLDANHDGYVTREEANAFLGQMDGMGERMEGMRDRMEDMRKHMETMRVDIDDRFQGHAAQTPGALFDKLDANHDGVISREEFMSGHAQMHEGRMMAMRSPGEMPKMPMPAMPAMPPLPSMPDMKVMHMHAMAGMGFGGHLFDMADANHDGRVSLQEAEAAALAHFDKLDLNHDGRITPDERQQVRVIRIERRTS